MLAIVPARGGSKGIPGKNLRNVAGRPLILHTLMTLRAAGLDPVVSTDCPTIASVARLHGYRVQERPARLAGDDVTVAQVAEHVTRTEGWVGPVGVFQPTSPTLTTESVREAIQTFHDGGYASLCSVTPDTKLRWDEHGPLYHARVNRQQADLEWRETGAIQLARACPVGDMDPLVGHPHHLFVLPAWEAHDIDTPDDLEAARRHLARRRINIRFTAGEKVGAGHLFRCLAIADELHHDVLFDPSGLWGVPAWVRDRISRAGYTLDRHPNPDLVISDALDTSTVDVARWKADGAHVVTLEDLGPGSALADLVVNELYDDPRPNVESGPRWAVLRPEFLALPPAAGGGGVLVMFGGTDPAHLSERVSQIAAREANVTVLLGPGAAPRRFASGVNVVRDAPVAELVRQHDLVVTSAGRTVHEVAACGVPVVSIAVNERESRHSHCAGVLRLGLHAAVSNDQIQEAVYRLLDAPDLRAEMAATARVQVDGLGARRIAHRIEGLLEGL